MKTNDRIVVKKNTIADLFGKRVEMVEIETSVIDLRSKKIPIEKKIYYSFSGMWRNQLHWRNVI